MNVHKTFLTILIATIAGSMTGVNYGFIRNADAVLTLIFVGIAWFAFGVSWEHRKWSPQENNATWHRVAPKLCLAATILTVAIPVMSLAVGALITKYAPQRIDGAMAKTVMQTPTEIAITTLPRASSPEVSKYVNPGTVSYIAAGTSTDIGISKAEPVLIRVLAEMDSDLRIAPTSYIAIALLIFLFFLWVVELASDLGNTKKS